jgi:hypothetical protein
VWSPVRALRLERRAERLFERMYGVDTAEHVYHEDLGLETDDRVWHDPSNWTGIRHALRRLRVKPHDVFADFGSGLGRALVIASTFPFRRVIGVEVSAELNERARANLGRSRARRRCSEIELVTADCLDWPIPPDLTVAYFYCPFTGKVFEQVIQNLLDSVDRHPRPLRIVYNYPLEHNSLLRTGRARVLDVCGGRWPLRGKPADVIVTYLAIPSDQRRAQEYEALFLPRRRIPKEWLSEYHPGFVLNKPARLGGKVLERPAVPPEGRS